MTASLRAARSIADLDAGVILATVEIAAPPERVFRAISTDEIVKWWGADDLYRTTAHTADLRVGGRWRSDGIGRDGKPFFVEGEFVEIDPPHKLVQTWKPAWDPGVATTITYRLEPLSDGRGTRLTLRHEGFGDRRESCAGHAAGWERVIAWLTGFVAPRTDRFFCVRLLAPRPTFMQDMTADERAVMGAHAAYWRGHRDAAPRSCSARSPIRKAAGGWVSCAPPTRPPSATFRDHDPAILANIGLSYEIMPMLTAVHG